MNVSALQSSVRMVCYKLSVDVLENIAVIAFSVAGFVSGVRLWWRNQKETAECWRTRLGRRKQQE